jgi:hypothetical protein
MPVYYHVTHPEAATAILDEGFLPGWGDAGLGVYLFDDIVAAEDYAARSGWDGELETPVLLRIETKNPLVEQVIPHPDWPDPEAYDHVWFLPMEDEGLAWHPENLAICPDGLNGTQSPSP